MVYAKATDGRRTINVCQSCGHFHAKMQDVQVRWIDERYNWLKSPKRCEVKSCGADLRPEK